MSEQPKDTDVVAIEEITPQTEELVPAVEPTPAEPVAPDPTEDTPSDEEVLEGLKELSRKHDTKSTRKEATINKEAARLEGSITDGLIDFDELATRITDTAIGNKALEAFAEKNGYTIEELKSGLDESSRNKRFTELDAKLKRLEEAENARLSAKEADTFVEYFKKQVSDYGLTPSEFKSLYGESFDSVYSNYAEKLGKTEAAKLAFELTIGKEKALEAKVAEVKAKTKAKQNAVSPKPTRSTADEGQKQLKTKEEVWNMSDADRIAYKKAHWKEGRTIYTN